MDWRQRWWWHVFGKCGRIEAESYAMSWYRAENQLTSISTVNNQQGYKGIGKNLSELMNGKGVIFPP